MSDRCIMSVLLLPPLPCRHFLNAIERLCGCALARLYSLERRVALSDCGIFVLLCLRGMSSFGTISLLSLCAGDFRLASCFELKGTSPLILAAMIFDAWLFGVDSFVGLIVFRLSALTFSIFC